MQNHTPSSLHHWHHFVDGYMLFRRVRCFFIISGWLQYLSFPITWLLCVLVNDISSLQTDFETEWSFIIPLSSTKLFCTSLAILIQDKVFLELIITSYSWVCPQCIYMCCIKSTKMCVERRVRMQFKSIHYSETLVFRRNISHLGLHVWSLMRTAIEWTR